MRPRREPKRAPLVLVVFVVALFSLAACRARTEAGGPGPSGAASAEATRGPTLVFEPSARHDFGRVTEGTVLTHSFDLYNRGKSKAELDPGGEVLGCRAVAEPSALAPGQKGRVDVTCRADVHGRLSVALPIRAKGHDVVEVSLAGEVEPLLAFDKPLVEARLRFGEKTELEARLRGTRATDARLELAEAPPTPGLEASLLPKTTVSPAGVRVRVEARKVGTHVGHVVVSTALERPKSLSLPYSIQVTGTLTVSPTNPYLNVKGPPVDIEVKSSHPGFVVHRAEVTGPFAAEVAKQGAGFRVTVRVLEEQIEPGVRGAQGRLSIVSNDESEPEKELPLLAVGGS